MSLLLVTCMFIVQSVIVLFSDIVNYVTVHANSIYYWEQSAILFVLGLGSSYSELLAADVQQ